MSAGRLEFFQLLISHRPIVGIHIPHKPKFIQHLNTFLGEILPVILLLVAFLVTPGDAAGARGSAANKEDRRCRYKFLHVVLLVVVGLQEASYGIIWIRRSMLALVTIMLLLDLHRTPIIGCWCCHCPPEIADWCGDSGGATSSAFFLSIVSWYY